MSEQIRYIAIAAGILLSGYFALDIANDVPGDIAVPVSIKSVALSAPDVGTPDHRPIESIRVGDRVLANNPEFESAELESDVENDWSQWSLVKLRLEKDLDPQHLIDLPAITTVETLYPNTAIQELALEVGDFVYVDKPEMSVWGFAEITGIEPAPAIEDGAGEVVTSTFKHTGSYVLDVCFEGQTEPIGVTATHPFWSPERQAFVAIGEMEVGESVQTFAGETKTISSKLARPGPQVVYNIEVDRQHVYFVGQNGLLVHNSSDFLAPRSVVDDFTSQLSARKGTARSRLDRALGGFVGDGRAAHHILSLDAITDASTSSVVQAAARGGFNINGANNGLLLSQRFHRGGHPLAIKRFNRKVAELGGQGLSDVQIANRLQSLVDTERSFLQRIEALRLAAEANGRTRIFLK
ncbi:MAG: polymorphic toxin-type HINT domain-containing protein [Planctomycetota bacterium]